MTTSGRLGGQTELTTDKSRLLAAIERFIPQGGHDLPGIANGPPLTTGGSASADSIADRRTLSAMAGLSAAARTLSTITHRRKGVLLISQGFPATPYEIMRNPRIGAAYESIQEFLLTAQRSNVAVYTADPCGLDADPGCTRDSRQNLRTIAEVTGGFALTNTNAPEAGVDRMLAEIGSYYLIGYNSPARPNDGRYHRITVRTRVPDVELRAREGYDSPGKAPKQSVATPLETLTRSVIQTRGLTMRVVAIPAPLPTQPSTTVIVGIELPTTAAARAGRIQFVVVAIESGRKNAGPRPVLDRLRQLGKDGVAVDPYRLADRPAARRVSASRGRRRRRRIDRQRVPRRVRTDVCGGARGGWPLPWCSELDCRYVGGPAPRCAPVGTTGHKRAGSRHCSLRAASDQGLVECCVKSVDDNGDVGARRQNYSAAGSHAGHGA